jgi:hypothetical protein
MRDPDLDFDTAIDLANRILAGEEVAEALSGTGLVVDMSPQPAQIAEIETSRGVVEVPVREAVSTDDGTEAMSESVVSRHRETMARLLGYDIYSEDAFPTKKSLADFARSQGVAIRDRDSKADIRRQIEAAAQIQHMSSLLNLEQPSQPVSVEQSYEQRRAEWEAEKRREFAEQQQRTTVVNLFKVETSAPGAGFKQLYRQRRGSRTIMGFDTLADAVKEAEHTLAIGDGDGYDVQTVRILRVDVDPETEEEIPNTGTVVWESSSRTSTPAPVVDYFPGSRRPSSATPVAEPSGVWQFSTLGGPMGGLLDAFWKFNYTEGLLSDYLHSLSDAEVKKVAKREVGVEVGGLRGRTKAELIDALVKKASSYSRRGSTFLSRKPSVYP